MARLNFVLVLRNSFYQEASDEEIYGNIIQQEQ